MDVVRCSLHSVDRIPIKQRPLLSPAGAALCQCCSAEAYFWITRRSLKVLLPALMLTMYMPLASSFSPMVVFT